MNATIKDIMTTQVVTVHGDTPFKEMAGLMGRSRVSAFPVTDDEGKVIGIVSEADMLIKEADQAASRDCSPGCAAAWSMRRRPG